MPGCYVISHCYAMSHCYVICHCYVMSHCYVICRCYVMGLYCVIRIVAKRLSLFESKLVINCFEEGWSKASRKEPFYLQCRISSTCGSQLQRIYVQSAWQI